MRGEIAGKGQMQRRTKESLPHSRGQVNSYEPEIPELSLLGKELEDVHLV
jgi:hypothetical protein